MLRPSGEALWRWWWEHLKRLCGGNAEGCWGKQCQESWEPSDFASPHSIILPGPHSLPLDTSHLCNKVQFHVLAFIFCSCFSGQSYTHQHYFYTQGFGNLFCILMMLSDHTLDLMSAQAVRSLSYDLLLPVCHHWGNHMTKLTSYMVKTHKLLIIYWVFLQNA